MRDPEGQVGGRTERESKERDILIEGAIMGLARNMALGKFPRIHRMTPAKNLSNSRGSALTAFPSQKVDNYLNCHHRTIT